MTYHHGVVPKVFFFKFSYISARELFMSTLPPKHICMKYQASFLCKLFLACSADFSGAKGLAYQPLLTT
jgi:hypothetical protein